MNLENTKVYTTDREVIRKYAELCGVPFGDSSGNYDSDVIGVSFTYDAKDRVDWFSISSRCNNDDDAFKQITPDQVNALYDEKFGKVETPEEAEAFDIMAQDNEQLQNYEMGERVEWKNGDECEIIMDGNRSKYVFGCLFPHDKLMSVVFTRNGHMTIPTCRLLKPETPQQREEREREKCIDAMVNDFLDQELDSEYGGKVAKVCAALYDAGYRKQKDGE